MIHVELSVAPHHKNCRYKPGTVEMEPDSPKPHTIIKKKFERWDEVRKFVADLGLKTQVGDLEMVCNNPNNEYVQVELEVLEVTGTEYTAACLSIEGQAVEPLWVEARRIARLLEAFNERIATDTNTHDGKPRGENWREGPLYEYGSGPTYQRTARRLRKLADLWEDG